MEHAAYTKTRKSLWDTNPKFREDFITRGCKSAASLFTDNTSTAILNFADSNEGCGRRIRPSINGLSTRLGDNSRLPLSGATLSSSPTDSSDSIIPMICFPAGVP